MRTPRRLPLALAACAAALAAPSLAEGAVSVGQSGWSWGSPLPQGNTLRTVEMLGARGYATGDFGTALRTDDGGNTWQGLTTGVSADLARVRLLGGDPQSFVVGGGCVLRRSDDGGTSFKRLPFTASEAGCPAPLASFAFPTKDVGYLVQDDGTVTRTADGGATFAGRTAVPNTRAAQGSSVPTDLAFVSEDVGVAITGGPSSAIYRTTDGGASWTVAQSVPSSLRSVTFVDADNGYAVGDGSSVYATTDRGVTWTRRALTVDSPAVALTSIRCATVSTCLISTAPGDRIFRTTDGGETAVAITASTAPIYAASYATELRVVGVGAQGATVLSDDGASTFRGVGGRLPGRYTGLRATSASVAYALGTNGALARTTDGGLSWTPGNAATSEDVRDVSFPTPETGFALDTGGQLKRTDNSGASWLSLTTGASANPLAVLATSKENVVLVGPRGIRRSTNGGEEFSPVTGKALRVGLAAADRAGSALFAYGSTAIVVSTNEGATFKTVKRPSKRRLRAVDFVTPNSGYAVDVDGRIYRTANRGKRWTEQKAVGGANPVGLSFADARAGWALLPSFGDVAQGGYVLRTDDGGASWRPQLISEQPLPGGTFGEPFLAATSARNAMALAGGPTEEANSPAKLFATNTAGDAGKESTLTIRASKRSIERGQRVTISGKLSPVEGGESAVIWSRTSGSVRWGSDVVRVASNGTFSVTTTKLRRDVVFVAQWQGDDDRRSDGTAALTVKVKR